MFHDCEECNRLWQEYNDAARNYSRQYDALSEVAAQHDMKHFAKLAPICQAAEGRRASARKALQKHGLLHRHHPILIRS
jgi:hypothetical protein